MLCSWCYPPAERVRKRRGVGAGTCQMGGGGRECVQGTCQVGAGVPGHCRADVSESSLMLCEYQQNSLSETCFAFCLSKKKEQLQSVVHKFVKK